MHYRELGRTGLKVSQLGFGAMRLPMVGEGATSRVNRELAIPMIHRAFEGGVNYIDTAVGYGNQDSQRVVGEALKGWRDRIVLSTKNHYYGTEEGEWWKLLEQSLERLQVDYIDIYNHHGLTWKSYCENIEPRVGKWMQKARDQGLIRHICCSFHDNNEALENLVRAGYPASITLPYNMLDRKLEPGIALAHEHGIGVVIMNPVGGGRLGSTSEVLSELVPGIRRIPELALRFVLRNPQVTLALSGMSTMDQVEENLLTAVQAGLPRPGEEDLVLQHVDRLKAMADLSCSGCGYCQPCPEGVNIPLIFESYNNSRVYGLWEIGREAYSNIGKLPWLPGKTADACTTCGECLAKCPQQIDIPDQLQEAAEALAATPVG